MKDLTIGKPSKVILGLSLPILMSVIFQQIYSLADSIIVGKFVGENALASIGATFPISMIFMAFAIGFGVGSSILISKFFGEKELLKVKTGVSTILVSGFVLAIILFTIGILLSSSLLKLIQTPQSIFADAKIYLDITLYSFTFVMFYNIVNSIFTALGDSVTPLIFLIISSIINIVLDLIFVLVFHWGVAGAAWATFISQVFCSVLSMVILLIKVSKLTTEKAKWFDKKMLKDICLFSFPSILQQCFISFGNLFVQFVINGFGESVIAGFTAAIKLNTFAMMSVTTMENSMSSYTAQNHAAGKHDRIKKGYGIALLLGVIICFCFAIPYVAAAKPIIGLFLKNQNAEALQTGGMFLFIVAPFYPLISTKITSDNILRGMNHMKMFMTATLTDLVLRAILTYVFSRFWGAIGICISWPIGWVIGTAMSVGFVLTDKKLFERKNKKLSKN